MSEAVKHKKKRKKKKNTYADVLANIFPCRGDTVIDALRKIIFLIAVTVFAVCAYLVAEYFYENYKNRELYDNIADSYIAVEPIPPSGGSQDNQNEIYYSDEDEEEELTIMPGAQYLLDINPDTVGYISIPDTTISYPLMQTTTEDKKEYYLNHNFMGEEAKAGAIFLDWRLRFDAEYQSNNLIIYGHDMKDGSMFGQLRKYKKEPDFYEAHPIIELNSNYKAYKYKIFGYFLADGNTDRDGSFKYWNYVNLNTEEEFYEYVNNVKRRTLRITDVDVKFGDKLVTLSTCSQEFTDSRFVIVARRLRDGEGLYDGTKNSYENPNPLMPAILGYSYDENAEFIPYG